MASPIPFSRTDMERRRLETTLNGDLDAFTLSSDSLSTTASSDFNPPPQPFSEHDPNHSNSTSFISSLSSNLSLEYPRAESIGISPTPYHHAGHHVHGVGIGYGRGLGPTGTPRAATRMSSRMSSFGAGAESMFIGASPVSTAGHHASAVTLGAGIFQGRRGDKEMDGGGGEFDPERSVGRLEMEMRRTTGEDFLKPRPASPFSPHRSPSPLPSTNPHPLNLSYTLSRNEPPLSPPSSGEDTLKAKRRGVDSPSHFSSYAREIDADLHAARKAAAPEPAPRPTTARRPLGESTVHNVSRTSGPRKTTGKEKVDRVRALQGEGRRSASAPVRRGMDYTADITGLTALLATPAKGGQYGHLGANVDVGGDPAVNIPESLAAVQARIRALETENSVNRRRVKELEGEVERAKEDLVDAKRVGGRQLQEAINEKSELEQLVKGLRKSLADLTLELEHNKALVAELREGASSRRAAPSSPHYSSQSDLAAIRHDVERLTHEVEHIGNMVEEQLDSRKRARGERTLRMEEEEMERLVRQVVDEDNDDIRRAQADVERRLAAMSTAQPEQPLPSRLRQGLHTVGNPAPGLAQPSAPRPHMRDVSQNPNPPPSDDGTCDSPTPASRPDSRQSLLLPERSHKYARQESKSRRRSSRPMHEGAGPGSPFPSIIGEDLEREFFSPLKERTAKQPSQPERAKATEDWARALGAREKAAEKPKSKPAREQDDLPTKVKVSREISETEERLVHMKTVYSEVSDQYKILDPASVRSKRHALANHLRDIIDEMELLSDRISTLYDTLSFYDPLLSREELEMRERRGTGNGQLRGKSVGAIVEMVKEDLGEEAYERLRRDTRRK
ncbi:hypothetical protein IAT38_007771 [Cryptococcus sp. DSM 104549]